MLNYLKIVVTIAVTAMFIACGGGEEDDMNGGVEVSLDAIADGEGRVVATGDVSATIDGFMRLDIVGTAGTSSEAFNFAEYTLNSDPNDAFITVYWPESEGDDIPNGSYVIGFFDASTNGNSTPSGRFIDVSVSIDGKSYSTFSNTSGTAQIANANADYELDVTFSVNNLEEFFDDSTISAAGALKYRD